jgi:hypothetical protein
MARNISGELQTEAEVVLKLNLRACHGRIHDVAVLFGSTA